MILTEEKNSIIKFDSEFTHIDYFEIGKVIVVAFKSNREARSFHNAIANKYIDMFEVERSINTIMIKARNGVSITNVTTDDSLTWLSISLSYSCSFVN